MSDRATEQQRTADIAQQLTDLGVTAHPLYHGGNIRIPLEDAERLIDKLQEQQ